jgi:hypothetical protein
MNVDEQDLVFSPAFEKFSKIPRFYRDIIITEKIDGTNAQIFISEDGTVLAGSRNLWIAPEKDNYGFAKWVYLHIEELVRELGPGRHFGEWWGQGIQRGYGLKEKRFSLFAVSRWSPDSPLNLCKVVPVLYSGPFSEAQITRSLLELKTSGSSAAPGFMAPEGIIIYHTAAQRTFKVTLENDQVPKGKNN